MSVIKGAGCGAVHLLQLRVHCLQVVLMIHEQLPHNGTVGEGEQLGVLLCHTTPLSTPRRYHNARNRSATVVST